MTSPNSKQTQKNLTTNQEVILDDDSTEKDESRFSPDNRELTIKKEKNMNAFDSPSSAKKLKLSNDPSPPGSHSTSPIGDSCDPSSRNRTSSVTRKILEQNPSVNQRVIQQSKFSLRAIKGFNIILFYF
jgi:hypothetical protein